ncbi:MAG: hypothetical protein A2Z72_01015 [Omnitrophica bacterium RBG_13_46_9]|nr:MAG: hypothetical protein A2Z72_01015 [Omnitrophica bacterium RBG_13_46_9]
MGDGTLIFRCHREALIGKYLFCKMRYDDLFGSLWGFAGGNAKQGMKNTRKAKSSAGIRFMER